MSLDRPDAEAVVCSDLPFATLSPGDLREDEKASSHDQQSVPVPSTHRHRGHSITVDIPQSTLVCPRSCHENFVPSERDGTVASERVALSHLLRALGPDHIAQQRDYIEFRLENFCVYMDTSKYPTEMRSLHNLATRTAHDVLYFDGTLTLGDLRFFVRRVKFAALPIGNYGALHSTVRGSIWIQSALNSTKEIFYQLGKPALEYARFFQPFLWVADLAKHVIDFSASRRQQRRSVQLLDFKYAFGQWLQRVHGQNTDVVRWLSQHPSPDFRTSVVANVEFIHKEMFGVLGADISSDLQLFREVREFREYEPSTPSVQGDVPLTVVTPYVKDCFGHTNFGHLLQVTGSNAVSDQFTQDNNNGGGPRPGSISMLLPHTVEVPDKVMPTVPTTSDLKQEIRLLSPGDVIATHRDGETTGTKWMRELAIDAVEDDRWFGLIQKVHESKKGHRSFDVIWLYRPVDTPCGRMKYPWSKELFLSDHCSCEEGRDARVDENEVLGLPVVQWHGTPESCSADFFVRQTYLVEQRRWVGLEDTQRRCHHGPPKMALRTGETILAVLTENVAVADPFEVLGDSENDGVPYIRLRKLLRKSDFCAASRPNELVYSDSADAEVTVRLASVTVTCRCLVRFFLPNEPIPSPYDRNGSANAFFITSQLRATGNGGGPPVCVSFENASQFPRSIRQGFHPDAATKPKLRGLDLFCGSGNFGRGLEDGGGIEMRWANDIWSRAIHTYAANAPDPNTLRPFLGSIDDFLRSALEGRFAPNVPRPGEVDFISAGSPCQGFSLLTLDKTTLQQRKNQSMVAAFATAVDLYRPKYGILENVMSIIQAGSKRSEDIFSQLICTLVGLGYQTQLEIGDAWSYGSPQSRSRVFLFFAAPGLPLPKCPSPSHSHPPAISQRNLGKMSNGEHFVQRPFLTTAFPFVSAEQATKDLPPVLDAKPDCCVPFPDHRVSYGVTHTIRKQVGVIPAHPYAMNFVTTWDGGSGVMTMKERAFFPASGRARVGMTSKGWGRVHPKLLFHTVATSCAPTDARMGRQLHWREHRPLTIMEVRRAQGFLDHEVLLGSQSDQWKLVGNSVARHIALAFGLEFREAWFGSLYDENDDSSELHETVAYEQGLMPTVGRAVDICSTPASLSPDETKDLGTSASSVSGMTGMTEEMTSQSRKVDRKRPFAATLTSELMRMGMQKRIQRSIEHPLEDMMELELASPSPAPLSRYSSPAAPAGYTIVKLSHDADSNDDDDDDDHRGFY